jgi:hypothetical protein
MAKKGNVVQSLQQKSSVSVKTRFKKNTRNSRGKVLPKPKDPAV